MCELNAKFDVYIWGLASSYELLLTGDNTQNQQISS